MAKHRVLTSNDDITLAIGQADTLNNEPRVDSVSFLELDGDSFLALRMSDGSRHLIPRSNLEKLANATDEAVSNVEIAEDGLGIRWPKLDLDFYIPYLLKGIYGSKKWMSALGERGGRARTQAKCEAARKNGLKGGRPRKSATVDRAVALLTSSQSLSPKQLPTNDDCSSGQGYTETMVRHSRGRFAILFGLDENADARALPRIA
jgi:hypothetical protein